MAKTPTRVSRRVRVRYSGPLFDGLADDIIRAFRADTQQELEQLTTNDIHQRLDMVLKHPTGAYERSIVTNRQTDDLVIHGDQVIYGAWLEGVADRNKGSRFKGYRTFRRAAARMSRKSKDTADDLFRRKYLGRLG